VYYCAGRMKQKEMFSVPTDIFKITAPKLIHAFDYFQVEVMAPTHYNHPARHDSNPVIIPMFIWMISNKIIQILATYCFGYL